MSQIRIRENPWETPTKQSNAPRVAAPTRNNLKVTLWFKLNNSRKTKKSNEMLARKMNDGGKISILPSFFSWRNEVRDIWKI